MWGLKQNNVRLIEKRSGTQNRPWSSPPTLHFFQLHLLMVSHLSEVSTTPCSLSLLTKEPTVFFFFFIISEASGAPSQCCPSFCALCCLKSLPKHKNRRGAGWGRENANGGRKRGRVTRRRRNRRTIIVWLQIRSIEILWFWTKLLIF